MQSSVPQSRTYFNGANFSGVMLPAQTITVEVVGWYFDMVGSCPQGALALGLAGGAVQGHLPPVFCQWLSGLNYKVIFSFLLLVLILKMPKVAKL